jgi:hypothetical protein
MKNGVRNVLDIVWELRLKALDSGVLDNINSPYFLIGWFSGLIFDFLKISFQPIKYSSG